jgi:beta-galactosidase GanA
MSNKITNVCVGIILLFSIINLNGQQIPNLKKVGNKTQLFVNEKPFLVLGGELGNSTATSMENMVDVWPKMKDMHLNTILVPIYWELIEPQEGRFDFTLYKELILEARKQSLKIIPLWFGSWKNSMSSHAPSWVKKDQKRFPRVRDNYGKSQEILSSFSDEVLWADLKAYAALMQFIKDFDSKEQTIIMMQVENEIGMLPSARDYESLAEAQFKKDVPKAVIDYIQTHKEKLVPEFLHTWKTNGYKTKGNWEAIFGKGVHTDEYFMAYYYGLFANKIAEAGKKIYPIPTFVNAALNRPGREPGVYPSAGPLPHVMDLWKAGGSAIDILVPDFYNPDFKHWCDLYGRQGDPLFVPEHVFDNTAAAKALYTFGNYEGIGFSPFHIEGTKNAKEEPLGKIYDIVDQLTPIITSQMGKGKIKGVLASKAIPETIIRLGKYELLCKHDYTLSWNPGAKADEWPLASAIIIQTGEDEFYIAGNGIVITFNDIDNKNLNVGLLKVDEGSFTGGKWKVLKHLNGDQTHQGRHINVPYNNYSIQRVELYTYK